MRNREMTTDVRHQTSEMSDVSLTSDSNFVIRDARGLLLVVGEIDLKIGKQRGRFARKRAQARDRHPADLELRADRKSTRLNSSHVRISYAVFCLKKKRKRVIAAGCRQTVPLGLASVDSRRLLLLSEV